jgi:hypothetical protein
VALAPEDMDFISNFSTLWAVFLGAILATLGGFGATQMEWYIERRRRERNAALFFGEVLSTLNILIGYASNATKIGDPYGPITLRLFRSAIGEVEIYHRNRETLYDLSHAALRARIHTLILRISMSIDGVFDTTSTIAGLRQQLDASGLALPERERLDGRIAALEESRKGAYDFILENAEQIKGVVKELEPIARFSFENMEKTIRDA